MKTTKKITKKQELKIRREKVKKLAKTKNTAQIAKELDVSPHAIRSDIKALGIDPPEKRKKQALKEKRMQVIELIKTTDLINTEIAKKVGISSTFAGIIRKELEQISEHNKEDPKEIALWRIALFSNAKTTKAA